MIPVCRGSWRSHDTMARVVSLCWQVRSSGNTASGARRKPHVPSSAPHGGRAAFRSFIQLHNDAFTGGPSRGQVVGPSTAEGAPQQQVLASMPAGASATQRLSPTTAAGPRRSQSRTSFHNNNDNNNNNNRHSVSSALQMAQVQRQRAQEEVAVQELRALLRKMKHLNDRRRNLDTSLDPRYEQHRHSLHLQLHGVFTTLQDMHFAVATDAQLIAMLYGVEASGGVRASFVVSACIHRLCCNVLGLSGRQLVSILNVVLGLDAGLWGAPQEVMRDTLGAFVRALLVKNVDFFTTIHPNSLCKLLHLSIHHHYQWAEGRGGAQVGASIGSQSSSPLLCDGLGCELLVSILKHCLVPGSPEVTTAAPHGAATLRKELALGHLVCIIEAIAFHRVPNEQALVFLSAAAPRIRDAVLDLNAHQLSTILIAYARVGYRNPEWFITVGQRAGDVGERMSEDEAANVLLAFSLVGIEHAMLRNSLESSMRMKHLRRSTLMNRMF